MGSFYGGSVTDTNVRLRLLLIVFFGMVAFASVLYWRSKNQLAAEYIDFPQTRHLSHVEAGE